MDICLAQVPSYRFSGQPDWITITYVCRYWRSAALGMPELWSSITLGLSVSWSRAMIERSAPLPMRINICIELTAFPARLKSLAISELLCASRIRTLSFSGPTTDVLKVLDRLCSPSPLESLSLRLLDARYPVDLPADLCGGDAPRFHRLALESSAGIRSPLCLLSGITHFTASARIPLDDLLDMLKAMPQLKMLSISHRYNGMYDANKPIRVLQSYAVLPRLSLLSFSERENMLHRLMTLSSHIDAPPTLRRHIYMCLVPGWDRNANIFMTMKTLIPHDSVPGADDGGLRVAQVIPRGPASGVFEVRSRTCSESAHAHASAFARENALFLLRIKWTTLYDSTTDERSRFFHLTRLCAHLSTTRIEDLTAGPETSTLDRTDVQDAQWQALLSALPAVKTLRLHRAGLACLSLLRTLSASASLLPLLQRVFVAKSAIRYVASSAAGVGTVDVAGAVASSATVSRKSVKAIVGAALVDVLNGRSGLEVVLVGCDVDEVTLGALRKRARVEIGDECVYMQEYM